MNGLVHHPECSGAREKYRVRMACATGAAVGLRSSPLWRGHPRTSATTSAVS